MSHSVPGEAERPETTPGDTGFDDDGPRPEVTGGADFGLFRDSNPPTDTPPDDGGGGIGRLFGDDSDILAPVATATSGSRATGGQSVVNIGLGQNQAASQGIAGGQSLAALIVAGVALVAVLIGGR